MVFWHCLDTQCPSQASLDGALIPKPFATPSGEFIWGAFPLWPGSRHSRRLQLPVKDSLLNFTHALEHWHAPQAGFAMHYDDGRTDRSKC